MADKIENTEEKGAEKQAENNVVVTEFSSSSFIATGRPYVFDMQNTKVVV